MVQNINQFAQTPVVGEIDLEVTNGSVLTVVVSPNQATPLVPGQMVKIDNTVTYLTGLPPVIATASASDTAIGVLTGNIKDQTYPANARVEMGISETCIYLQADTSNFTIPRFTPVEASIVTPGSVQAWQGVNPIIGYAYDGSTTAGTLLRVIIRPPIYSTTQNVKTATFTATLAQINAGLVAIAGSVGKKITVTNFIERVTGAFATGTSVNLQSDATSVIVESTAEVALTNGAILGPFSANVTLGAGFSAALPVGEGLKVVNIGSAQTGGTSITYTVIYTQA